MNNALEVLMILIFVACGVAVHFLTLMLMVLAIGTGSLELFTTALVGLAACIMYNAIGFREAVKELF